MPPKPPIRRIPSPQRTHCFYTARAGAQAPFPASARSPAAARRGICARRATARRRSRRTVRRSRAKGICRARMRPSPSCSPSYWKRRACRRRPAASFPWISQNCEEFSHRRLCHSFLLLRQSRRNVRRHECSRSPPIRLRRASCMCTCSADRSPPFFGLPVLRFYSIRFGELLQPSGAENRSENLGISLKCGESGQILFKS